MNWDDLLARKVRPPFVPSVVSVAVVLANVYMFVLLVILLC